MLDQDPAAILEVAPQADAAALRAAYLEKVRQFPPDRYPTEFERARDAYEILSDPRRRLQDAIARANPLAPFADLATGHDEARRRHVGLDPWIEAVRRLQGERR